MRRGKCIQCGEEFDWTPTSGPVPATCDKHRKQKIKNEARVLPKSMHAAWLAVGLYLHNDPKIAARTVGLPEDVDLASLEVEARRDWAELIEGSSAPLFRLLQAQMLLNGLRAVTDVMDSPASNLATATQRAAQTVAQLHTAAPAAYTGNVKVVWEEVDTLADADT